MIDTEDTIDKVLYDRSGQIVQQALRSKPLTKKQKKAVDLLCAGLAPKIVADTLGISGDGLNKWRKLPAFKVALSEEMQVDADLHGVRLRALYGKAITRVSELLDDPSPHIRVQAARLAFEAEQNIMRVAEEAQMMRALEERMDQLAAGGAPPSLFDPIEPIEDAEIISESPADDA